MTYYNVSRKRAFTLVELMIVVAILGILAASGGSLFTHYLSRSKTQEAVISLAKIAEAQISYHARADEFSTLGPTNIPPSSTKVQVDFFSDPSWNWQRVGFSISTPIYYGYQSYASGTEFVCEAQGDLDGDGDISLFSINVGVDTQGRAYRSALIHLDELE